MLDQPPASGPVAGLRPVLEDGADLVVGERTERTSLPWVDQRARPWEPEPLRWLGIHGLYRAYGLADRLEARGGRRTSWVATLADRISGR